MAGDGEERLAALVHHPLGVILGVAQAMDRRVTDESPLRLPVRAIVREALRCKGLVQKEMAPLDLSDLVRSTALLLEARARVARVRVVTNAEAGPLVVDGNRTTLQQVLVNLGNNAMDAMPDGGTLTMNARADVDGAVRIEVADTGTGIPEEIRSKIFDPFFTTKEAGKGTGLGLSLAYEAVRHHRGTIDIESETGRGSTFVLRFPAAAVQTLAAA